MASNPPTTLVRILGRTTMTGSAPSAEERGSTRSPKSTSCSPLFKGTATSHSMSEQGRAGGREGGRRVCVQQRSLTRNSKIRRGVRCEVSCSFPWHAKQSTLEWLLFLLQKSHPNSGWNSMFNDMGSHPCVAWLAESVGSCMRCCAVRYASDQPSVGKSLWSSRRALIGPPLPPPLPPPRPPPRPPRPPPRPPRSPPRGALLS